MQCSYPISNTFDDNELGGDGTKGQLLEQDIGLWMWEMGSELNDTWCSINKLSDKDNGILRKSLGKWPQREIPQVDRD